MKANYFIMTIRNKNLNRQVKFTVENGVGVVRKFELYPFQHILHEKIELDKENFKHMVRTELMIHMVAEAGANVYFNGDNFRKYVDGY